MRWVIAVVVAVGLVGCSKSSDGGGGPSGPEPIPEVEKQRGREACARYAERACECAKTQPDQVEDCQLAESRVEALEATLRTLEKGEDPRGKLSRKDVAAMQGTARKTMKGCFEAEARLRSVCGE